jgi:hypothetical protein
MMLQRHGRLIIIGILSVVDIAEDEIPEGRCCQNLAAAFFDHEPEILAFTRDLRIPFDNNRPGTRSRGRTVAPTPQRTYSRRWRAGEAGRRCGAADPLEARWTPLPEPEQVDRQRCG